MAPERRRCKETKDDGTPCGAPPEFVDPETGLCWTHSEGGREKAREAARKGGEATARKLRGADLDPEEVPEAPETLADAVVWAAWAARAAATGKLSTSRANAAAKLLREFRQALERHEAAEQLEEIRRQIEEAAGGGEDVDLDVVEGDRGA